MIESFGDQATEDIFNGVNSRAARTIPQTLWPVARRKLDMLNAAGSLRDLGAAPGNRLEKLSGDLQGKYSIRVNDQYRIVFGFEAGNARQVRITDYH